MPFSTQSPLASRCPMTCAVEMKRGRKLDVWWPVEAKQKKVKASMRPSAKRRVEYSKTLRITLLKRASFSKPPFWWFKMLVFGVCNYIYIKWFQIFLCSSLCGEMIQHDLCFSDGLKPPSSFGWLREMLAYLQ